MKIYITSIDEFDEKGSNSGVLFDLADYSDHEDFMEAVKAAHPDASAEDLTVSDWGDTPDTLISYFDDGRIPDADEFEALKKAIEDDNLEAFGEYIEWVGGSMDWHAYKAFEGCYKGEYDSEVDFAKGFEIDIPDHLEAYFDYDKYADSIFLYDYHFANGHVFQC